MMMKNIITTYHYHSPCGTLLLGAFGGQLCLCDWVTGNRRYDAIHRLQRILHAEFLESASSVTNEAVCQLNEYFAGQRREFNVPLLFAGTEFQKKVWAELQNIPFGCTVTYQRMAERADNPRAVRAVASAIGANAISIFAPCHRVIGSNHSLTGYRGGTDTKRTLLELEGAI